MAVAVAMAMAMINSYDRPYMKFFPMKATAFINFYYCLQMKFFRNILSLALICSFRKFHFSASWSL